MYYGGDQFGLVDVDVVPAGVGGDVERVQSAGPLGLAGSPPVIDFVGGEGLPVLVNDVGGDRSEGLRDDHRSTQCRWWVRDELATGQIPGEQDSRPVGVVGGAVALEPGGWG